MNRQKILLIEDDSSARKILEEKLTQKGCKVITAQNEQEFWKHILASQADLVIFEVCLKNRLGSDVYRALLELHQNHHIPVIFKTGLSTENRRNDALYDENYVFFSEPVSFECLYTEICKLINHTHIAHAA